MRAVVQRVREASVTVGGQVVGRIGPGLLVYLGVAAGDGPADIEYVVSKIRDMRIFADADGRMNRPVTECGNAVLAVSQFTLAGDVRKGRRPAFDAAERPEAARAIYDRTVTALRDSGLDVATGIFQADMAVASINDGPVTLLLDSRRLF